MSTTVRIRDEDKARLERIQDEWRRRTGTRPTLQHVIGALARHGEREPDHVIHAERPGPTAAALAKTFAALDALGGWEGDARDVDQVLYGGPEDR